MLRTNMNSQTHLQCSSAQASPNLEHLPKAVLTTRSPRLLPETEPQGAPESPGHELQHQTAGKKQTHRPLSACTSPVGSFQSLWVYFNENNMKTWADSFLLKRKKPETIS